jgi:hypothetical protein
MELTEKACRFGNVWPVENVVTHANFLRLLIFIVFGIIPSVGKHVNMKEILTQDFYFQFLFTLGHFQKVTDIAQSLPELALTLELAERIVRLMWFNGEFKQIYLDIQSFIDES